VSALTDRLNSNKYVRFPFVEDASMLDITATRLLPDDFIVDFSIVAYFAVVLPNQPLTFPCVLDEVVVDAMGTQVQLTFIIGGVMDTVTIPVTGMPDYYTATKLVNDVNGTCVYRYSVTVSDGLKKWAVDNPGSDYSFSGIRLEPCTAIARNNHRVMSIRAKNQTRLAGDIQFREGYNVRVTLLPDFNTLRFYAVLGEGAGIPCEPLLSSSGPAANCDELIYFINGMHPDWYGQFFLQGMQGVMVEPDPSSHTIGLKTNVDRCKPACPRDFDDGVIP
jgi:hypothetical protein